MKVFTILVVLALSGCSCETELDKKERLTYEAQKAYKERVYQLEKHTIRFQSKHGDCFAFYEDGKKVAMALVDCDDNFERQYVATYLQDKMK